MKLCTGCKYLVHAGTRDVCKAQDGPWVLKTNPYTGRSRLESEGPHGGWRPTVVQMRASGAACGPDAVLYERPWWWRILSLRWLRSTTG